MKLKTGKQHAPVKTEENLTLPEHLGAENIDRFMAGLSDEQVRRLLINELKAQAQQETTVAAKPEGIAGFIHKIRNLTAVLQARIELLRSGGSGQREVSGVVAFLGRGERGTKTVATVILSVAAVLAGALLIEWLFVLYTAAARRSIITSVPSGWVAKIGALSSRALLDFAAIVIFIVAALILFFIFLDRTPGQRVLLAAYLAGFAIVQGAYLVLSFFLAPRASTLRILPFSDQTALYLHHWLMGLIFVICLGNMTTGVIRLAGATELTHIMSGTLVGLLAAVMLIWMILQKRKEAAISFSQGLPESSLRYRLAQKWHHFAIFAVLLLLASAITSSILGTNSGQAMLTLLMVALYFMLDWILRLMLEAAFGIVAQPQTQAVPAAAASDGPDDDVDTEAALPPAGEATKDKSASGGRLDLDRMKG
ncbi:MAG: hypothetical protein P8169_10795, partial [Chloroflexota bacterium]